jgi:hypothetical protein
VFFFLQRLPAWLRIQLEGDDQDDVRRLATKAEHLFALHGHKHSGAIAVVESQEDEDEASEVNAVQGGYQRGSQHGGQCGGQQGRGGQGSQSGSQQQGSGGKALMPSEAAAAAAGIRHKTRGCLNAVAPGQLVHIVSGVHRALWGRHRRRPARSAAAVAGVVEGVFAGI